MTRTLSTIFAFTFALLITTVAANAQSARTFVSTAGNDANTASLCSAASPCRSFGAAVTVTNTNGEVIALTSGGYGVVTITKGVQITAPTGVYAAITALSGDAITVNAAGAVVLLRGLTLNSQGATNGIIVTAVGALHVEGCIVNGFSTTGINVSLSASGSKVFINDTIARNGGSSSTGIRITTTTGTVTASIDGCRAENNGEGFLADINSRVTVRNSVASGNSSGAGFSAISDVSGVTAEMNTEHCVASNNGFGFYATGGGGTATMRVARSTATNNSSGFLQTGGGTFESLGDNLVRGNSPNNTFGTITVVTGN